MLLQLEINNVALIDKVNIEFEKGLNILTGETGAGKSIIIDSINAVLGERLSRDLIRNGTEKAVVEAVFEVNNKKLECIFDSLGIEPEEDGTLIMSREFTLSGKNVCRVNGKMTTVSMLKQIGERIIDIHGQHDNQSLLRTESHIELLDSFAGEHMVYLKTNYNELLSRYRAIKNRLKTISGDKNNRERKLDLLKFQIDEIKKARLKSNEDEELNRQRLLLSSSEKILEALSSAYDLLFSGNNMKNSATDSVNLALQGLNGIARFDDRFGIISKKLEDIYFQLDDVIGDIRKERDSIEFNPGLIEEIEERLDLLFRLKRKYGNSIEDILIYYKSINQELEDIIKSEATVDKLNSELNKTELELYDLARSINQERMKATDVLDARIGYELDDLEMKRARFKTCIEFNDSRDENGELSFTQNGLDKVEFLISPNAGEPLKPLSKIASGGEMSRVMLAIKTILANVDQVPVLIFDEIDIGISGRAAQKVGEKLSLISNNHQVICVTHLPQIACIADNNYLIEKTSDENSTRTQVRKLEGEGIKNEIARMLDGSHISDITLKHAEEMLYNAKYAKIGK